MLPAHLARTVQCLEILFRYGADLSAVDVNGRYIMFTCLCMCLLYFCMYMFICVFLIKKAYQYSVYMYISVYVR